MALWIQNLDDARDNGNDYYVVRINQNAPLAYFEHDRTTGAAQCLRDAANAIDAATKGSASDV